MKALVFILFAVLIGFSSSFADNVKPPKKVDEVFKEKFPKARNLEWEFKKGYYVADFKIDFTDMKAWYYPTGEWFMTLTEMTYNSLPTAIRNDINSGKYSTWEKEDVDKIERPNQKTLYIIQIENDDEELELHYLENGTLQKIVTEKGKVTFEEGLLTNTISEFINTHYPNATITEIEHEKGMLNVEIIDNRVKKELFFDHSNNWIVTTWEVSKLEVPEKVLATVTGTSYGNYKIEDIHYEERANGTKAYIFDFEKINKDLKVIVNAETQEVLLAIQKE